MTVYKLVAADTVDEDIYDMGERKRQLSHAVLSDERAGSSASSKTAKSPGKGGEGAEPDDMNAIGTMLQKALARRAAAIASSSNSSSSSSSI